MNGQIKKTHLSPRLRRKKLLLQGAIVDYVSYIEKKLKTSPETFSLKDFLKEAKNKMAGDSLQTLANRLVDRKILKETSLAGYGLPNYDEDYWKNQRQTQKIPNRKSFLTKVV